MYNEVVNKSLDTLVIALCGDYGRQREAVDGKTAPKGLTLSIGIIALRYMTPPLK